MTPIRYSRMFLLGTFAAFACTCVTAAQEKLPPNAKVVKLDATPATCTLKGPFEYNQLLITAQLEGGDRVDVTRLAQVEKPANVTVSPTGQVRPVADGNGQLKFTLNGQSVVVPVAVSGRNGKPNVNFIKDVMPILAKVGCNAGTCHGAQSGKNGFKLSLRGYDPLFDHQALTDDLEGRRFNRAAPETSLMLLKTSGAVPHVGGVITQPGEPYYETLKAWIADGVKFDTNTPRVSKIDILPKSPTVPLIGMKQQMAVIATYTDGSTRDVSAETFIESSNTEIATVDKLGLVTTVRRGETAMLARYEGNYTATMLIVMGDRSGFTWKDVPEHNYIDTLVHEKLKSVKILPSDMCTDAEFIRRIYLDLIGLPPTPDEVRAFLADGRPTQQKRDELVDRLVGSSAFVEHWTNKWADLLQVNRKFLGDQGAAALRRWIRDAINDNVPYDRFAYQVLTASGSNIENPPAAYLKTLRDAPTAMENTTQLFLAIRFNCNKCHDHPFERWTQDQYYHLAAFFAQVNRAEDPKFKGQKIGGTDVEGAKPLVEIITDTNSGDVKHDRTGLVTPPQFPYTHAEMPVNTLARRTQLAKWITSQENPYFAKSYVNRIWSYLIGTGLIEPIDDIRAGNPPSNPKLLDRLTEEFIKSGLNTRALFRTICKSRTYQLSIVTNDFNKDDEINYSHAIARRLPAEVLYDAIHRTTGAMTRLPGLPPGARAAELLDSNVEIPGGFLTLFGKPPRESACECERSGGMMLGPILNLVNGPVVGEALRDPENRINKLIATTPDDRKVVEEIFLSILNRLPSEKELAAGVKALQSGELDLAKLQSEYKVHVDALAAYEKALPTKQTEWEKQYANVAAWTVLDPTSFVSKGKASLSKQMDGSILAAGTNPTPEVYTVKAKNPLKGATAIRLEALNDPTLPGQGPGRAPNGNFVLSEFKVSYLRPARTVTFWNFELKELAKTVPVTLTKAQADFSQDQFPVANAIDNNPATGWAIVPQLGRKHVAVFEVKEPMPDGVELTFTLDQRFTGRDHNLGKFRLSVTNAKQPVQLVGPPDNIAAILATPPEKRTEPQKTELSNFHRGQDAELARLQQALNGHPKPPTDKRYIGAQDLAWALINSPEFLFNH